MERFRHCHSVLLCLPAIPVSRVCISPAQLGRPRVGMLGQLLASFVGPDFELVAIKLHSISNYYPPGLMTPGAKPTLLCVKVIPVIIVVTKDHLKPKTMFR